MGRVRASICFGIKALAIEKVILDELEVSVKRKRLVVDVALFGVRTDDKTRVKLLSKFSQKYDAFSTPVTLGATKGPAPKARPLPYTSI